MDNFMSSEWSNSGLLASYFEALSYLPRDMLLLDLFLVDFDLIILFFGVALTLTLGLWSSITICMLPSRPVGLKLAIPVSSLVFYCDTPIDLSNS